MMRKLFIIAALIMGAANAWAGTFETPNAGFHYDLTSPQQLADLVGEAIRKDKDPGRTIINPAKCKQDRSCATPMDYLVMIRQLYREFKLEEFAPKTVSELPSYLRRLVKKPGPAGNYWSSCLKPDGKGGWTPVLRCFARPFKPGESVWVDPLPAEELRGRITLTHDVEVFMEDCSNPTPGPKPLEIPIVGPFQKPCAEIRFFARASDKVVRLVPMGLPAFEDECFAIRKVGEERWIPWKDACHSGDCSFAASESFLQMTAWNKLASFELTPGEYVVRVPRRFAEDNSPYLTAFCLDRAWPERPQNPTKGQAEAWNLRQSDAVYVRPNAYRVGNDGVSRATIYASEAEVPASETVKMYWRFGVWAREQAQQTR